MESMGKLGGIAEELTAGHKKAGGRLGAADGGEYDEEVRRRPRKKIKRAAALEFYGVDPVV